MTMKDKIRYIAPEMEEMLLEQNTDFCNQSVNDKFGPIPGGGWDE